MDTRVESASTIVCDAVVVGAGPAGATAALALAEAGPDVVLVGPEAAHDPRTTALLGGSVEHLARLGVWADVEPEAAPLVVMRLVDDTGRLVRAPEVTFESYELGLDAFGWNVPNDALNAALAAAVARSPRLRRLDASATEIDVGPDRVTLRAGDRIVRARLAVAADGAASPTREAAGLPVRRWRYEQAAIVATLRHSRAHHGVSTEFHTPTGPFTLVPLPGNRSSLVWIERPATARRLIELDDAALARTIETRARSILGTMTLEGPRAALPLEGHIAERFAGNRVALVGEAGHRFPPIGAQGLNLGIRDGAELGRLVGRGIDPGAPEILAAYDRARRLDTTSRTVGVDLFNRSLLTDALPVQMARSVGLWATGRLAPLRRFVMRQGLGALPSPARARPTA